jgi:hypothetical protein
VTSAPASARPPRPVLLAAAAVVVQGVAGVVGGIVGIVAGGVSTVTVWGFVILLGLGYAGAGGALVAGARGARGPAVVAQLLLLGIAFYAAVPSERPEWGVPIALLAAAVLAGLLGGSGRAWADA